MTGSVSDYSSCVIQPGYLAVSEVPAHVAVVCGNGVVVCLRNRITRSGGVAHCIYPRIPRGEKPTNYHAEHALKELIKNLAGTNKNMTGIEAFIFGGGDMRGYARKRAAQTVSVARKILKRYGINVVTEDVGGSLGRKIVFNTYTGDVLILKTRKIRKTDWAPEFAAAR